MSNIAILDTLSSARTVANHALSLGINIENTPVRNANWHLGATLADAILQPGLNYNSVVLPRVQHIQNTYPEADELTGVMEVIESNGVPKFLKWKHPTKITRFILLAMHLHDEQIQCIADFREWLKSKDARKCLLSLNGIGPKTFDYICCLVGFDRVPVDRHIKTFAIEAGIQSDSYDELQLTVSYAADLLGISRREFDAWIWNLLAKQGNAQQQLELL